MEAEGIGEKIGGKVQKKIGQVKRVLGKSCEQLRLARVGAVSNILAPQKERHENG
jgi:hypothetical protein